jgi:hypothetical protein
MPCMGTRTRRPMRTTRIPFWAMQLGTNGHAQDMGRFCLGKRDCPIWFRLFCTLPSEARARSISFRMTFPNRIDNRVSEFVERQDLMVFIGFKTDSGSHAYPARGPGQQTEEGETGAAHFNGTSRGLPSDAESTSLLDFVVALDVSVRCRAFLMRSSNSPSPPLQLENLLPVLGKHRRLSAASKWLSCSLCKREQVLSQCPEDGDGQIALAAQHLIVRNPWPTCS